VLFFYDLRGTRAIKHDAESKDTFNNFLEAFKTARDGDAIIFIRIGSNNSNDTQTDT